MYAAHKLPVLGVMRASRQPSRFVPSTTPSKPFASAIVRHAASPLNRVLIVTDSRSQVRVRTFLKGRIVFNSGNSTFDCLIRDMSGTGAKLVLTQAATLPEVFDLHILNKGAIYRAQIRWRRADQIGVRFLGADAQHDARTDPVESRVKQLEVENEALREEIERLRSDLRALRAGSSL